MGTLEDAGVQAVYHYAPLHYLPFIARSGTLMCKPSLAQEGFASSHLRSKSKYLDVDRGFGAYAHLTVHSYPNILRAKLAGGFPHVQLKIPVSVVEARPFSLCRYNVAMTRQLRRNGKPGFPESPTNGRYYQGHLIPIARTSADQTAMLQKHLPAGTMIEVLVHGNLPISDATEVICFSQIDQAIAQNVLTQLGVGWLVNVTAPPSPYPRSRGYGEAVRAYVEAALADASWRGNGLEYDRV